MRVNMCRSANACLHFLGCVFIRDLGGKQFLYSATSTCKGVMVSDVSFDSNPYWPDVQAARPLSVSDVYLSHSFKAIKMKTKRAKKAKAGLGRVGEFLVDTDTPPMEAMVGQRLLTLGVFDFISGVGNNLSDDKKTERFGYEAWRVADKTYDVRGQINAGSDGPTWMQVLFSKRHGRQIDVATEIAGGDYDAEFDVADKEREENMSRFFSDL